MHTTRTKTVHYIVSVSALSRLLADPTLTLHNVTTVVTPVRDWNRLGVCIGVPLAKYSEIDSKYSTDDKRKEAVIDYWLRCSPVVSWGELAGELHYREEKQSLQLLQRHLKKTTGMLMMMMIINHST